MHIRCIGNISEICALGPKLKIYLTYIKTNISKSKILPTQGISEKKHSIYVTLCENKHQLIPELRQGKYTESKNVEMCPKNGGGNPPSKLSFWPNQEHSSINRNDTTAHLLTAIKKIQIYTFALI